MRHLMSSIVAVALIMALCVGQSAAFVYEEGDTGGDGPVMNVPDRGWPGGDLFPNHDPAYIIVNLTNNDYRTYTSGDTPVFPHGYYFKYPCFNADGTRLACVTRTKFDDVGDPYEIWVCDYDGATHTISNPVKITSTGGTGDVAENKMCSWSRTDPDLLLFLEAHITQANPLMTYDCGTSAFATLYDPALDTNGFDSTNPGFYATDDGAIVVGSGYNTGNDRILLFDGTYPSTTISSADKNLDPASSYDGTRVSYYSTNSAYPYPAGSIYTAYSGGVWTENTNGWGDPSTGDVPGLWAFYSGKSDDRILSLRSDLGWTATALALYASDGTLLSDLTGDGGTDFQWVYANHGWEGPGGEVLFRAEQVTHSGYGNNMFIALAPPSAVWVDDGWTGPGNCGGHSWGYDAYATIQEAVDAVAASGTVNVAAGTYVEALLIEKPLSLLGATAGINKNGYTVPAGYAWDDTVESIIKHPTPTSAYNAIVDIYDTDDVVFKGFVVEELSAVGNLNTSLVRVYAYSSAIEGIVVENNIIGPNTNTVSQDGTHGRMGLYLVNYPHSDQGIKNSSFSHNKIFDAKGNGNNIFLWSSYYAYGAPGPASMAGTVIDDNEIYGSHRSGIETAGGFADLTISNNDIYGNSGLPGDAPGKLNYGHGILLIRGASDKISDPLTAYGPVDLVITGNDIHDNEKSGIYMGPKNDGIYITENLIHDNGWNGVIVDLAGNYWNPQFESPPASEQYACYDCSQDVFANDNSLWGNGGAAWPASDYGVAVNGTPTNSFILDASWNWWGHPSGPYHDPLNTSGEGDPVSDYVDIDPYRSGNIVCDPDPQVISLADYVGGVYKDEVVVEYVGGGSGDLWGYSIDVAWDNTVVSAVLTDFSRPDNGPFSTMPAYLFQVVVLESDGSGAKKVRIDAALGGSTPGTSGPCELFKAVFTAVGAPDYATSAVVLAIQNVRDSANLPLTGFIPDDGEVIVDLVGPVITGVEIQNDTVHPITGSHAWVKDTDNLTVYATVTDGGGVASVTADVTDFGGGGSVAPDASTTYEWTLTGVNTGGANGSVGVEVTATDTYGNTLTGSDVITADNIVPAKVTGFAAAPAHKKVALSWDDASGTAFDLYYYGVVVRYEAWGAYPVYGLPVPDYPVDDVTGDGQAFLGDAASATHSIDPRDIYYYSAFVYDWALNHGPVDSDGRDRATNYWLGDVARPDNEWIPDGYVYDPDIVKLSGIYGSAPPVGNFQKCDVGPTDDHSRVGIPEPDNSVSFEDLMIFAMNYDVVAPGRIVPFLVEPVVGDLALALVENGRTDGMVELALRLEGNLGEVKGLTAELEFEGMEFVSARLSDEMSSPLAEMFFWSNATDHSAQIDAAVLGTDVTIGGSGDVAVLTFQVLDETYAVDFTSAQLRGAANEDLTAELDGLSSDLVPVAFKLVQNAPNPFNPVTKVAYHVPSQSRVTIRVFDVTGRLVTTLVDGVVEAGRHAAVWNGTNDRGESVGSGVYFCTMETPDYRDSHKMTLLK